jgi:inosose dehydratase
MNGEMDGSPLPVSRVSSRRRFVTNIIITTAPSCWGVDDVRNPNLPPWQRVVEETAQAGYGGLELGPYGYMPLAGEDVWQA